MRLKAIILILFCVCVSAFIEKGYAQAKEKFYFDAFRNDPALYQELEKIVSAGLKKAFGEPVELSTPSAFFQRPLPIFVTLRNARGEVRACMGSLYPSEASLRAEIFHKIELALFKDPRHRAVLRDEFNGMELYISEVGRPIPIRSVSQLSPARDGAYLRQGSREAVLLPGEAKTQRYMLALLKAKAGVIAGEPFQLYRLQSRSVLVKLRDF